MYNLVEMNTLKNITDPSKTMHGIPFEIYKISWDLPILIKHSTKKKLLQANLNSSFELRFVHSID